MKTIGVVTIGRSDYGIYLPVLKKIRSNPLLRLRLIVGGMHLEPKFGNTIENIVRDEFQIDAEVRFSYSGDTPNSIAKTIGGAVAAFSETYAKKRPDILLVLGDRFEMHAAVLAALPFNIPIAHIHGGELTLGAIDNALRYSISACSHLHFVATEEYKRRLEQIGEEPWRVVFSGAPALDSLQETSLLSLSELSRRFELALNDKPLLVTFHPVTLEYEQTEFQMTQLLKAVNEFKQPIVFTAPNADTGNGVIWKMINSYVQENKRAHLVKNFGSENYFSMMAVSLAMVGNSSSGLIEAPSLQLPVVNIGTRQEGRIRAKNVIDVGCSTQEIAEGIRKAISPQFRSSLQGMSNPYGTGRASEVIVSHLESTPLGDKLIRKRFIDIP